MSSYATSCIQTLDYLLRKHDYLMHHKVPDTLHTANTRDRGSSTPLTVEEHDRIWVLCQSQPKRSPRHIAREVGRSAQMVWMVGSKRHRLYDEARCSKLYPPS